MDTKIRVTVEEINPETNEVVDTLISEKEDGLYEGICVLGDKGRTAQVFIHHLSSLDLCNFFMGSKELMQAAKVATVFAKVKGEMGDSNGTN